MTGGMIHVSGHIDVPAADISIFETALADHVRISRAEPGCVLFSISPAVVSPGRFEVHEVFVDLAAFEAHTARTRSSDWWDKTGHIPRTLSVVEK